MTTTFSYPKKFSRPSPRKQGGPKISLFSPLAVLLLVTLVFVFFLTASSEPSYLRGPAPVEIKSPDPVHLYKQVVTNADAIRSVLQ